MMASSSSSKVSGTKYDVFISFRGTDVRSGFLSHLKEALEQEKIDFYVDDRLKSGDEISTSLLTAIDESLISLIIFSKDYAESKWCLEELEKIMECKQKSQQIVIPVFYNIEPSVVRHQIESYGDAFIKHEKNYGEKVQIWRSALKNAAKLSGICSSHYRDEAGLVEKVVKSLSTWLNMMYPFDLGNLVGIDKRIEDLQPLMHQDSQDVCVIGIWGMGGIGKTTLATTVFNRFCFEYEGFCFLENVREVSQKQGGVIDLKNKLYSSILKEKDLHIGTSTGLPPHVQRKLRRTKILLVLDDINDSSQLENLVGKLDCFGHGSRIIITTRDKDVLKGVAKGVSIETYEVMPLTLEEALELFILNAFEENCRDEELHALSRMVIEYAKELPLAVKVLGSFLRGKNKEEWKSQLEKLKKMPFKKIHDILRLSYDTLDRQQKHIFLYIACFFKGYPQCNIIDVFDACGFSTIIELKVLRDKALITWTSENQIVSMHDLIEEMGKEIVREESMQDLGKCRHLWDSNDICEVLRNNKGTEYIESIALDRITGGSNLLLRPQVFSGMHNLKILYIFPFRGIELPEGLDSLPNELRILYWTFYPLEYLPSRFCPKSLVELDMKFSNLQKLWDGEVLLENLKMINLSGSNLVELPDLSSAKNLQEILLQQCENLQVVHPSIFSLPKLKTLDLTLCGKLTYLKSDTHLESLSYLFLSNCMRLEEFSMISEKMIELDLSYTNVEELPLSIGCLGRLEYLKLLGCESLTHLPSNLVDLTSLHTLMIIGCKQLQYLPQLPPSIKKLRAQECTSLKTVQFSLIDGIPFNKNLVTNWLRSCINLDGQSRNATRLIARLNLTNYAHKSAEEREKLMDDGVEGIFIYPGRKVPRWFKHRTRQGSITVTPHSKLLGFIFCMVLHWRVSFKVDWFLKNSNSERLNLFDMGGYTDGDILTFDDLNLLEDECLYRDPHHVYMYYAECNGLINERVEESRDMHQNPTLSFEFHGDWKMDSVIKKCGVHPIYAKEEDDEEEEDEYDEEEEEDEDDDDDEEDEEEEEEEDKFHDDDDEEKEEEEKMRNKSKRSEDMDELPPCKRQEF